MAFKGCSKKMSKKPRFADLLRMMKKCNRKSVAYKSLSEREKKKVEALVKRYK